MGIVVAIFIVVGALVYKNNFQNKTGNDTGIHLENNAPQVQVIKIGDVSTSTKELNLGSSVSWYGEIISPKDGNVLAKRDGSIASWNVSIGQNVYAGQVLGRLSPPPKTPDVVQAIAGQSEALAKAKAEAKANTEYTARKIEQLNSLRNKYSTSTESTNTLSDLKKKNIRIVLQSSIAKLIPLIFTNANYTNPSSITTSNLIWNIGAIDSSSRNAYPPKVVSFINDLKSEDGNFEQSGLNFFDATSRILASSLTSDSLSVSELQSLKTTTITEKEEYLAAVKEYKESLVVNNDRNLTSSDKNQDIDAQILQLEKDQALSQAELIGKQASYNTVVGGLLGGLEIVSPRSGVVSTINKNVGDYVKPEDVLGFITSQNQAEKLIRFKVPSNSLKPVRDQELTVVRPGYIDTKMKIKVIGIGNSLDSSGSFLADGKFIENTDWPINSQVRVLNDSSKSTTATIPFSAIFFGEDGDTAVWTVTSENKLQAKDVKTGRTFGDNVEIEKGLLVGDVVVTKPIEKMVEGMLVSSNVGGSTSIQLDKKSGGTKDESQPHSHDE